MGAQDVLVDWKENGGFQGLWGEEVGSYHLMGMELHCGKLDKLWRKMVGMVVQLYESTSTS